MARITPILQEACSSCKVNLPRIIGENISILNSLGIETKRNTFDLGREGGSRIFKNNSQDFTILIDPIALSDFDERTGFKDAFYYELAHEMAHPDMTQNLRWFEKATLQLDMFLNNNVPPDAVIMDCVKNTMENIKIDSLLIRNNVLRSGFYKKQNDEYIKTHMFLEKAVLTKQLEWIGHFLGICRRSMVSRKDKKLNKLTNEFYGYNVRFRNQVSQYFETFYSQKILDAWILFKKHFEEEEGNQDYHITKKILELSELDKLISIKSKGYVQKTLTGY